MLQHKSNIYQEQFVHILLVKAQALLSIDCFRYMLDLCCNKRSRVFFECVALLRTFLLCKKYRKEDKTMEKTYLEQVGERLFKCRTRDFYSRRELAERAGVSVYSVRMMERGEAAVGIDDALKICKVLGCSTDYILTGKYGLQEMLQMNQKLLDSPDVSVENLQKIAQAFFG